MFSYYLIGAFFVIVGGLFFSGHALRWLSGWQSLPAAEKARVRIVPLCHNLGGVLALAGLLFLAGGYSELFREAAFRWAMVGWFALGIVDVLYIDRSGRYLVKSAERRLAK